MMQTTLGKRWLVRMTLFIVLCAGFAAYSLYDAMVAYPNRAIAAASLAKFNFLDALTEQGRTYATIDAFEPRAELRRLRALPGVSGADAPKRTWLEQSAVLGRLDSPELRAEVDALRQDPRGSWEALSKVWLQANGKAPSVAPLSWYDIPVQWVLFAACTLIALYLAALLLLVARRKYRWDAAEQRLTLPDGSTLVPAEVEDFDKRRWDKFLIFLKVRPGHTRHGGQEIKLDLYRHHPLEEWVLAMERTAFPERAAPTANTVPAPQGS
ncbi:MAG: hypothetical protein IT437_09345 [Phycisphaerales bacterium]|nr:hypothetical protein [Phycisphaerales bacterium]